MKMAVINLDNLLRPMPSYIQLRNVSHIWIYYPFTKLCDLESIEKMEGDRGN